MDPKATLLLVAGPAEDRTLGTTGGRKLEAMLFSTAIEAAVEASVSQVEAGGDACGDTLSGVCKPLSAVEEDCTAVSDPPAPVVLVVVATTKGLFLPVPSRCESFILCGSLRFPTAGGTNSLLLLSVVCKEMAPPKGDDVLVLLQVLTLCARKRSTDGSFRLDDAGVPLMIRSSAGKGSQTRIMIISPACKSKLLLFVLLLLL